MMSIHEYLPPQARKVSEGRMSEGFGANEDRAPGRSGLRLYNLVAQGA